VKFKNVLPTNVPPGFSTLLISAAARVGYCQQWIAAPAHERKSGRIYWACIAHVLAAQYEMLLGQMRQFRRRTSVYGCDRASLERKAAHISAYEGDIVSIYQSVFHDELPRLQPHVYECSPWHVRSYSVMPSYIFMNSNEFMGWRRSTSSWIQTMIWVGSRAYLEKHVFREIQSEYRWEEPGLDKSPSEQPRTTAQIYDALTILWCQILECIRKLLVCTWKRMLMKLGWFCRVTQTSQVTTRSKKEKRKEGRERKWKECKLKDGFLVN
jgi:hypothetical protein